RALLVLLPVLVLGAGGVWGWNEAVWPLNQHSEKALARRAQLYWDLKTSGDIMGAYEIMAESYRRRVTPAGFAQIGGGLVIHTGAAVESVELDEAGAAVSIELRHYLNRPAFRNLKQTSKITERWVFEDGAWHRWPMGMARG
ncbi:MAG: hypothetical protein ABGZ17_16505, partial [Planctomycetaceae bacterium]